MVNTIVYGTGGSGTRAVVAALRVCGAEIHPEAEPTETPFFCWLHEACGAGVRGERIRAHVPSKWPVVKAPRLMIIAGQLATANPQLKCVHVVRDGRDMAFSSNVGQFRLYAKDLLGRTEPTPENRAEFWQMTNLYAHRKVPPSQRIILRFEDLCADPTAAIAPVVEFLGLSNGPVERVIKPPTTIGRYRDNPSVEAHCREALQLFGYI